MSEGNRLARGAVVVTAGRALGLLFTLLQVRITTRYLGTNSYAMLSTVTLFVASFGAWTELGLGQVVVRRVSGRGHDLVRTVGLAMSITQTVAIPLLVATNVVGWVLYRDEPMIVLGIAIVSLTLVAQSRASCFMPVAQVTGRFNYYAAADLGSRIASLVLVIVATHLQGGLPWFFAAQVISPFVLLASLTLWSRRVGEFHLVLDWRAMWALFREALPILYILVVGVLYFTIDGILLTKLGGPEDVSAYNLSHKSIGQVGIVSAAVGQVLTARFARQAATSPSDFVRTLGHALRIMLLIAVPIAMLIWPVAANIVELVGSPEFVPFTVVPMSVICVALALGLLSQVVSAALVAAHHQRFLTRLNTLNLVVNISLNLILIPHWGATGAAIALVATEGLGLIACYSLLRRNYPAFLEVPSLLGILASGAVALGVSQLLVTVPWLLRMVVVMSLFVIVAFLTRGLRRSDIALITRGEGET